LFYGFVFIIYLVGSQAGRLVTMGSKALFFLLLLLLLVARRRPRHEVEKDDPAVPEHHRSLALRLAQGGVWDVSILGSIDFVSIL
jgi:hypothetical protein